MSKDAFVALFLTIDVLYSHKFFQVPYFAACKIMAVDYAL